MIHEKFIRACQVRGLVAHFPLNGTYGTKEINNWMPKAVASDVILAKGPNGHSQGSYQFNGSSNSYIMFSNYNGGPLDVHRAICITCWLYYDGKDGPSYPMERVAGVFTFRFLKKKLHFRLFTRQVPSRLKLWMQWLRRLSGRLLLHHMIAFLEMQDSSPRDFCMYFSTWLPLISCDLWRLFKVFMESIRDWRIHFTLWSRALRKHNESSALYSVISDSWYSSDGLVTDKR